MGIIRCPMSTGYRPPSREPQGRWARHIHAVRKERGWSQTYGFEQVREGLNLAAKSRTAYIPLDIGTREPTPEEGEVLASVYGWPSDEPPEPLEATETPASDLAAAIRELVETIRSERAERLEWERGVVASIREVGLALGRRDDPAPALPGDAQR
jgi:hypothetical protein